MAKEREKTNDSPGPSTRAGSKKQTRSVKKILLPMSKLQRPKVLSRKGALPHPANKSASLSRSRNNTQLNKTALKMNNRELARALAQSKQVIRDLSERLHEEKAGTQAFREQHLHCIDPADFEREVDKRIDETMKEAYREIEKSLNYVVNLSDVLSRVRVLVRRRSQMSCLMDTTLGSTATPSTMETPAASVGAVFPATGPRQQRVSPMVSGHTIHKPIITLRRMNQLDVEQLQRISSQRDVTAAPVDVVARPDVGRTPFDMSVIQERSTDERVYERAQSPMSDISEMDADATLVEEAGDSGSSEKENMEVEAAEISNLETLNNSCPLTPPRSVMKRITLYRKTGSQRQPLAQHKMSPRVSLQDIGHMILPSEATNTSSGALARTDESGNPPSSDGKELSPIVSLQDVGLLLNDNKSVSFRKLKNRQNLSSPAVRYSLKKKRSPLASTSPPASGRCVPTRGSQMKSVSLELPELTVATQRCDGDGDDGASSSQTSESSSPRSIQPSESASSDSSAAAGTDVLIDFMNRIQNEDPLEGTSWMHHPHGRVTYRRKGRTHSPKTSEGAQTPVLRASSKHHGGGIVIKESPVKTDGGKILQGTIPAVRTVQSESNVHRKRTETLNLLSPVVSIVRTDSSPSKSGEAISPVNVERKSQTPKTVASAERRRSSSSSDRGANLSKLSLLKFALALEEEDEKKKKKGAKRKNKKDDEREDGKRSKTSQKIKDDGAARRRKKKDEEVDVTPENEQEKVMSALGLITSEKIALVQRASAEKKKKNRLRARKETQKRKRSEKKNGKSGTSRASKRDDGIVLNGHGLEESADSGSEISELNFVLPRRIKRNTGRVLKVKLSVTPKGLSRKNDDDEQSTTPRATTDKHKVVPHKSVVPLVVTNKTIKVNGHRTSPAKHGSPDEITKTPVVMLENIINYSPVEQGTIDVDPLATNGMEEDAGDFILPDKSVYSVNGPLLPLRRKSFRSRDADVETISVSSSDSVEVISRVRRRNVATSFKEPSLKITTSVA